MTPTDVLVMGGGFAGLAAATALAAEGRCVTVLEKRPQLGGRAYSYTDATTGEVIDNGQHAMMGCYTEMFRFLGRIGATDKLAIQPGLRVDMLDPERQSDKRALDWHVSRLRRKIGRTQERITHCGGLSTNRLGPMSIQENRAANA